MSTMDLRVIRPQAGPQEMFLSSPADIVVYGGAAGGGKTWALLLETLRHIDNPDFGAVIFRRTSPMITNEGGLWDEAGELFPLVGGVAHESPPKSFTFPSGASVTFTHLQHEKNKHDWQGGQIPLIGFDELTHFTEGQFWYMLSRNRSMCGVRPYIRATTNPDADSWVAELIRWWIDQETGEAIPERSGVIRWFYRVGSIIRWYGSKDEAMAMHPDLAAETEPKSLTFIPARLEDNPKMLERDPGYRANLMAQQLVDRMRLLGGNWKIRATPGNVFRREWFEVVDASPAVARRVRFWDLADSDDGDSLAGVRMALAPNGIYYVEDVVCGQYSGGKRDEVMRNTATRDMRNVEIWIEQEPGSTGKSAIRYLVSQLSRYNARGKRSTGSKVVRAKTFSAQAEAGNVKLVRAPWNEAYLSELEAFPTPNVHDDQVDASSGAFARLLVTPNKTRRR